MIRFNHGEGTRKRFVLLFYWNTPTCRYLFDFAFRFKRKYYRPFGTWYKGPN